MNFFLLRIHILNIFFPFFFGGGGWGGTEGSRGEGEGELE